MIFIIGVGRSGTSLLQNMLNAHPDVCFLPEISFLRRFVVNGWLEKTLRDKGREFVIQVLKDDKNLQRLKFEAADFSSFLPNPNESFSIRDGFKKLTAIYNRNQGEKPFVGVKDPRLVEYIPFLHAHFPGARIIHIFRDPRDVLASKKKVSWARHRPVLLNVFANRIQFKMAGHWGKKLFRERFYELSYENLLVSPEQTLKDLSDFIGISYDAAMMSFKDSAKKLVVADELGWKQESIGPLLSNNTYKWVKELTAVEAVTTELLCSQTMKKGQYQKSQGIVYSLLRTSLWSIKIPFVFLDFIFMFYRKHRQ